MKTILVTADVTSAIFLVLTLLGCYTGGRAVAEKTKYFLICLWLCLAGLLLDALSYLLDGAVKSALFLGAVNYLAYVVLDVFIVFFSLDLRSRITQTEKHYTLRHVRFIAALSVLDILMLTAGTITGFLFTIENGVFVTGPWNAYSVILPTVCVLINLAIVVKKVQTLGFQQALVIIGYLITPMIVSALQMVNDDYEFGYVGSAAGLALIYIVVQSRIIAEANVRAEMYSALSTTDVLTGLKNRRAYNESLSALAACGRVGAVFCDINSLKEVNDTIGHEEGDALIRRFALLLSTSFPDGNIFRISGDEFAVLFPDPDETDFPERMRVFADLIRENDRIASFGWAIGEGRDAPQLVRDAERQMHLDKDEYYRDTGRQRRR